MSDQQGQPIVAEIEGIGELEFPAGTDPSVIQATVKRTIAERSQPADTGRVGALSSLSKAETIGAAPSHFETYQRMRQSDPFVKGAEAGMAAPIGGQPNAVGNLIQVIGNAVNKRAIPLVRSAIKIPVAAARARAGVEGGTPNQAANRIAKFIVDEGLTSQDQASKLVKSLGSEINANNAAAEAANPDLALDTAERIPRYFNEFTTKRIEKQMLPGKDRAAVANVGREVVNDSPLSRSTGQPPKPESLEEGLSRGLRTGVEMAENVGKRAPSPGGSHQFTTEGGAFPKSSRPRELRTDVKPSEATEMLRTKSFFDKNAPAGTIQGGKVLERAVRDSAKEAVPANKIPLLRQGRAMDAERMLDRSEWLSANRDPIGMGAIAGIANGRPLLGLLMQALKEGSLRAGVTAGRVGPKITRAGTNTDDLMLALQRLVATQTPTQPE